MVFSRSRIVLVASCTNAADTRSLPPYLLATSPIHNGTNNGAHLCCESMPLTSRGDDHVAAQRDGSRHGQRLAEELVEIQLACGTLEGVRSATQGNDHVPFDPFQGGASPAPPCSSVRPAYLARCMAEPSFVTPSSLPCDAMMEGRTGNHVHRTWKKTTTRLGFRALTRPLERVL